MTEVRWQWLTTASDVPSAQALAGRLAAEGIDVRVASDAGLLGQATPCTIYVDSAQLHRVRWAMSRCNFTEQELAFLSTGELAAGRGDW